MAKRGLPEHSKTRRLMRTLDIPKHSAVGLLECLWQLTAREAPTGDIGKLDNEDIAQQLDWRGDPDTLIRALVDCRWLDEHPTARLLIHDWPEHREDTVDNWLAHNGHRYADGSVPRMNRLKVEERTELTAKYFSSSAQEAHAVRTKSAQEAQALPSLATATARPEPGRATARPEPEPGQAKPEPSAPKDSQQSNGTASLAAAGGGAASRAETTATATTKAFYEAELAKDGDYYPALIRTAFLLFREKTGIAYFALPPDKLARRVLEGCRYNDPLAAIESAIDRYAAMNNRNRDWVDFWRRFESMVIGPAASRAPTTSRSSPSGDVLREEIERFKREMDARKDRVH